jgi:hypothetical protein
VTAGPSTAVSTLPTGDTFLSTTSSPRHGDNVWTASGVAP